MHPNGYDPERRAEQRAALRRLRRAQLAEARRIRQAVAATCLLTLAHLLSPCRVAARAEARQVAMYLMRTRLTWPRPTRNGAFPAARIGRLLGGRDHSTVIHDVAVIVGRLDSGRDHSTVIHDVAVIVGRLDSGQPKDASLRQMVRVLAATLDATYEAEGLPRRRAA